MRFIEDFKENDHIIDHYLCKQKQSLKTRTGKTYLSLKLQDKTGLIDGKVWEMTNDIQDFEENEFIKIDGLVLTYQNDLQIKINRIRRSSPGEYDAADYIPRTDKDISEMYRQITTYIKNISNPFLRQLLESFFVKDKDISTTFQSHSAAKNLHHNFYGGLIEHTLSVTQICEFISGRYKYVNRDLLIASAILHDLGKIYELSPFPGNDYTDDGQLLGHIVICSEMISREADKIPNFPKRLKSLLMHSILAHHGELEYGSPKQPKTMEAFILHFADNIDAKLNMFAESVGELGSKTAWSPYNKILARNITNSDFSFEIENGKD
ncbi:MAG: HD domain-containing protein [Clostridiales bacterium]|jgi:3'-5' exoribonuclease|nr:HD domain-containing protein [Clostridiales bacterium]